MWMWILYIGISLVVIAALIIVIIYAPNCKKDDDGYTKENCCGRGGSIPLEYIEGMNNEWFTQRYLQDIDNNSYDYPQHYYDMPYTGYLYDSEDDPPRKYIGHRYDRDHDRKPTQYSQLGHD